jgi:hypothetical protein
MPSRVCKYDNFFGYPGTKSGYNAAVFTIYPPFEGEAKTKVIIRVFLLSLVWL